jgi:hypothetical protein
MVPDPATTPDKLWGQVVFGASIAAVYGLLVSLHVAFGLFYSLTIVCAVRGFGLHILYFAAGRRRQAQPVAAPSSAG